MSTTITNEIEGFIASIVANSALTDNDVAAALNAVSAQAASAAFDLTAPLTSAQRGVMFGLFTDVFGSSPKSARRVFTRLVLGKATDTPVSWAAMGTGTLTQREAAKVIDALTALQDALV